MQHPLPIKRLLFFSFLLLFSCAESGNDRIRIAFINSFKGRIFARKVTTRKDGKKVFLRSRDGRIVRKSGISLLSSLVKKLEQDGPPMIKLANSNFLYGSSEAYFTDGRDVVRFLGMLGFSGMVIGHRDFYFGPEMLGRLARSGRGAFLCANIVDRKTGKRPSFFKPWIIYRNGVPAAGSSGKPVGKTVRGPAGHAVAVIGLITRTAIAKIPPAQFSRFRYVAPREILGGMIRELRKMGVTRIVVMGDYNIRKTSGGKYEPEADLRAVLRTDVDVYLVRSKSAISQILSLKIPGSSRTARAAAIREGADCLGVYTFSVSGKEDRFRIHAVDSRQVPPDLSLSENLYNLHQALDVIAGRVIGSAAAEMTHSTSSESPLGNLVTDALREYCRTDIVLINSGAVKSRLAQGPISRKDLYTILPYQNMMVGLRLSGTQLLEVLENSVANLGENMKSFPQVSGVRFIYNPARPAGKRIVPGSVLVGNRGLDPASRYTLAVPAFIATGGDKYGTLADGIRKGRYTVFMPFFDQNDRNIVEAYIERSSKTGKGVFRVIEGRIRKTG